MFSHFSMHGLVIEFMPQSKVHQNSFFFCSFLNIFAYTWTFLNAFHSRTGKIKALSTDAFSRLLMGNAACIFTVQERIGGPFVEITITVITNFKAMPACGCEDRVYYYLRRCTILISAMHERPSQITSSVASNTTFSWEWKAVTLLSTYSSSQRELNTFSDFFFFFFLLLGHQIFFHSFLWTQRCQLCFSRKCFCFPHSRSSLTSPEQQPSQQALMNN